MDGGADDKRMRLRYAGACRVCGAELPAKVEAIYERTTKTVRCVSHDVGLAVAAWAVGAVGEERLGRALDRLSSDTLRLLHDRRIPRSTANIDHLAVTSGGGYVIDAKKYPPSYRQRDRLNQRACVDTESEAL